MKTIKIKFRFLAIAILISTFFNSCVVDDDDIVSVNEPAGVLPIVTLGNSLFDLLNPDDSTIDFIVSPSESNGIITSSGEIHANLNNGEYIKVADITNFPFSYDTTLTNTLTNLGLGISDISGGDNINFRFYFIDENDNKTTSATLVTAPIICPPIEGLYTIIMKDSYGDGWQGGGINIIIDGNTTFYNLCDYWSGTCSGPLSSGMETFTVPNGSSTLVVEYVNDSYNEEVSFQIFDPNGDLIADVSNPTAGSIALPSTCP